MAAYAALVSLMNTIDDIKKHPRLSACVDDQIQSLCGKLDFLLYFVESHNSHRGETKNKVEDLEWRITSSAYAAADIIESNIVDLIHAGFSEKRAIWWPGLKKVMVDMDSIMEEASKVALKRRFSVDLTTILSRSRSRSRSVAMEKRTMVGFDGYLSQLLQALTGEQRGRQIIPIVGIGGIGKTTLARNAFENPIVLEHFDFRAWVTVSQEYNLREILLGIIHCHNSTGELDELPEDELRFVIHKFLYVQRYLIVLDDVWWDRTLWDKIKFFIPDNEKRSRVIITTRISKTGIGFPTIKLNFLDEHDSWHLFCQKAFEQEDCPFDLEDIGKRIVRQCKGLPLAIVVIAGFLRKSPRIQENWENVARDICTFLISEEGNQCLDILSLSYSHLPACLKPCFLYTGLLLKDNEVRVSRLIKLWVAEGFIKPNSYQVLEDIAEGYVKDLTERNLIFVGSLGITGKIRTCKIHDFLRFLCIRIAQKEKFLGTMMEFGTPQYKNIERRIIIQRSTGDEYHDPQLSYTVKSGGTEDEYHDPQLSYTLKSGGTGDEYHDPQLSYTLKSGSTRDKYQYPQLSYTVKSGGTEDEYHDPQLSYTLKSGGTGDEYHDPQLSYTLKSGSTRDKYQYPQLSYTVKSGGTEDEYHDPQLSYTLKSGGTGDEYHDPQLSYTLKSGSTRDKYQYPQLSYTLKSGSIGDRYHDPQLSYTLKSGGTGDEYHDPQLSYTLKSGSTRDKYQYPQLSYTLKSGSTGDRYHDPQLSYTLKSGSTAGKYHGPLLSYALESKLLTRTVISESPTVLSFKSRLLRILIEVYNDSLDTTFQQVNLRCLAYESICAPIGWIRMYELPSSISLLWNVQTLILDKNIANVVAPSEIWKMPQLRHLKFHRISLPDPPSSGEQDYFVLQNLQTLGIVLDFKCSEEVCWRIPNIRKLHMFYDDFSGEGDTSSSYGLHNLGFFNKLRSLRCGFLTIPKQKDFLPSLNFPYSLEKLILQDCEIQWSDLTKIGALPFLKVLKLKHQSARGREWNPVEGEFQSLQFLEIDSCYLIYWNADSSHFPRLQNIVLCRLHRLIEIPLGIGERATLQSIYMVDCSISATISAMAVAKELESWGNEEFQVRVRFRGQAQLDEFMMKMGPGDCSSSNFHIDGVES